MLFIVQKGLEGFLYRRREQSSRRLRVIMHRSAWSRCALQDKGGTKQHMPEGTQSACRRVCSRTGRIPNVQLHGESFRMTGRRRSVELPR